MFSLKTKAKYEIQLYFGKNIILPIIFILFWLLKLLYITLFFFTIIFIKFDTISHTGI